MVIPRDELLRHLPRNRHWPCCSLPAVQWVLQDSLARKVNYPDFPTHEPDLLLLVSNALPGHSHPLLLRGLPGLPGDDRSEHGVRSGVRWLTLPQSRLQLARPVLENRRWLLIGSADESDVRDVPADGPARGLPGNTVLLDHSCPVPVCLLPGRPVDDR